MEESNPVNLNRFIKEGTFAAFPLCFPGISQIIPPDESHITALDRGPEGFIYGGTSGFKSHLFVGMFHGALGAVFDIGVVKNTNECSAICCGKEKFIACLNGPEGGKLVTGKLQSVPDQLMEDWNFVREPFEKLGTLPDGEKIIHAISEPSKKFIIGITNKHIFKAQFDFVKIEIIGEIKGAGRITITSNSSIIGKDNENSLWKFNPETGEFNNNFFKLPEETWKVTPNRWARDPNTGKLYTADDEGYLYSYLEEEGFIGPLEKVPASPVGPMAVTNDGRLFGFSGKEETNLFVYYPTKNKIEQLGIAASYLERRRFGYKWGDAVLGKDGEIFLGEEDNQGHLWIYFPSIIYKKT